MKKIKKMPWLIIILAILFVTGLSFSRSFFSQLSNSVKTPSVLGEEDEDEDDEEDEKDEKDEDDEEDEKDEKDEDDEEDEKDEKDDDDDKDEDEDKDHNEDEEDEKDEADEDDEKDEDEDEDENEDNDFYGDEDDEDEIVKRETVKNADGTTTEKITKIDGDETEIKEITYDQNGNIIMIKETETEKDGKTEIEVKTFDIYGNRLGEYELKTKDGKVVKVQVEEDGLGESKVKFDAKNETLIIKTSGAPGNDSSSYLRIKTSGENFILTRSGRQAVSNFPMTVDEATGRVLVRTAAGNIELRILPDTIIQSAQNKGGLDIVQGAELSDDKGLKYVISGTKTEKFFGVFTVEIPAVLTYDAQTGSYVRSDQPFFSKVLDLFSF